MDEVDILVGSGESKEEEQGNQPGTLKQAGLERREGMVGWREAMGN